MQNEDICNFQWSLSLIKLKTNLIFLKSLVCHCVKYDLFFHSGLNERKLMACFGLFFTCTDGLIFGSQLWYAVVSNMTFFFHSCLNERKLMVYFGLCVSPVLMESEEIWNFHS